MTVTLKDIETLAQQVADAPAKGRRKLVALAGAPASGKSTLAEVLAQCLTDKGHPAEVVPMDGFHLDNQTLADRGHLSRKGAPHTFDAEEFVALANRLAAGSDVQYPTFDRTRDVTVVDGGTLPATCEIAVVEGNYLLFDAPVWRQLAEIWDLSVRLDVPLDVLRQRLIDRWLAHGLAPDKAAQRAEENDLANARAIAQAWLPSDVIFIGDS